MSTESIVLTNGPDDEQPEWEYRGVLLEMTGVPHHEDDDLSYVTPSITDGLNSAQEYSLRIFGCEIIQLSGQLLKLPQVAMATAQILYQRFYRTKSFVRHNYEHYAMACIHLAAKIEECPRRIRDTINVFNHMRQAREQRPFTPLIPDQSYVNLKNHVVKAERRVLKELGFCVHVKHPHKLIICYLQFLGVEKNQNLVQCAWNLMNDSLRTNVFVRFDPETIACSCIYLAARQLGIRLPEKPGDSVNWWEALREEETAIRKICLEILHLYSLPKPKVKELEQQLSDLVEKRRHEIEKKQSEREAAATAAASAAAAANTSKQQQAFSVVPGGLLMRNPPPPTSSASEDSGTKNGHQRAKRRSRSVDRRAAAAGSGHHSSSVDGRSNGRSSAKLSSDKYRKHAKHSRHDRRSRSRSASRTPKAYRRQAPSRSRSRTPQRRSAKPVEKWSGGSRGHRHSRRRSPSSLSPPSDHHHRSSGNARRHRPTKNSEASPRRHRRHRRNYTSSTTSSTTSSSSSSSSAGRRSHHVAQKSGKRSSGLSAATINGRKKVHRDKDKH